jgi:hypothetical protein
VRSGTGSGADPTHCAGVASVTASRSGLGKTFGGIRKQRGTEPYPVMKSMDAADRVPSPDIGRISDLAGANVVVGPESHDAGRQSRTLTIDVVLLASVKVPVALLPGDAFPQPDVKPAKANTSSDAPLPGTWLLVSRTRRGRAITGPL